jgi:hypothetical protein
MDTPSGYSSGFVGSLDDIRIYNRLLSASEITALYHEGGWNDGLVAYYPFNGNADDESGNGHNGTNNGATLTADRFGLSNKALYFPLGSSGYGAGYVQLQNTSTIVLDSAFTVGLWIKLESNGVVFDRDVIGTYTTDWYIYADSGKVIFSFGTYDHVSISRPINDSKWHNLIFIRDKVSGYLSIYLDGILDIQSPNHTNDLTDTPIINLGNMDTPSGYSSGFVGSLDDIRIYNRLLSASEITALYINNVTSVNNSEVGLTLPKEYFLCQNYPNPFNPSTTISYTLPKASCVTLKVYDMLGRIVATLVNQRQDQGKYTTTFDASRLSSGVYFTRLTAGDFTKTMKMALMK